MSTKYLDANNVIKKVYDPSTEALRTTAIATFAGDTVEVVISDENDSIRIGDGEGDYLAINDDGSINTVVTGELEVEINAADGDNIAISDGVDTLAINSDGSINVNVVETATVNNTYSEVTSVPSSTPTILLSYTPINSGRVSQISVSGNNIATYEILVNAIVVDKGRTYFSGGLNYLFDMSSGYETISGIQIQVRVTHDRPSLGDFNARLQFVEE